MSLHGGEHSRSVFIQMKSNLSHFAVFFSSFCKIILNNMSFSHSRLTFFSYFLIIAIYFIYLFSCLFLQLRYPPLLYPWLHLRQEFCSTWHEECKRILGYLTSLFLQVKCTFITAGCGVAVLWMPSLNWLRNPSSAFSFRPWSICQYFSFPPLFSPSPSAASSTRPHFPPLVQSVPSSVPGTALPAGRGQRLPEGRTGVATHTPLSTQLPVASGGLVPSSEGIGTATKGALVNAGMRTVAQVVLGQRIKQRTRLESLYRKTLHQ